MDCTDLGNARRLVERHGEDLRFCHAWNKWLVWDGHHWAEDNTGEITRRAQETILSLYTEAAATPDLHERQRIARWAAQSESGQHLASMLKWAKAQPTTPVMPDDFDQDPWAFNAANGVIDLTRGSLRPHNRMDMCSMLSPVPFLPNATCPQFLAYLRHVLKGDEEVLRFIQRIAGYCMTGDTREQCLFMIYGGGENGKSTLLETLRNVMGVYAHHADFTTFLVRGNDVIRNDLARLRGARLVTAVESEQGKALAESVVKQLVGGDTITARKLYSESFEFMPTFKLLMATNYKPIIQGQDWAIWRRLRLIPFLVTISASERNKTIKEVFRAELPGIMAWMIRGCNDWLNNGLGEPESVINATADYRLEMDIIGKFLNECSKVVADIDTSATDFYKAYVGYCHEVGEAVISQKMFGSRLLTRGMKSRRRGGDGGGRFYWQNVMLTSSHGVNGHIREE